MEWGWDPDSFTAVAAMATLGVLVVGAIIANVQLRHLARSSRFNAVQNLYSRFDSPEMQEARKLANRNRQELTAKLTEWDEHDADEYYKVCAIANFFEDLGMLVNDKHLILGDIRERFSGPIVRYHRMFAGYIALQQTDDPDIYRWFADLADKICTHRT